MKVVIDGHGGDYAPTEVVLGAIKAVNRNKDLQVVITGNKNVIQPIIDENYQGNAISVLHCEEVITNDDVPTIAVRQKRDSSMVRAFRLAKEDESVAGVVSAGNTGALLTASIFVSKRIKGISRPCLAPSLPNIDGGKFVIVDSGANADCKPINLQHFAIMGSCYMQALYGTKSPRVGLLSNGAEKGKGNELVKETYDLLEDTKSINFVGNAEARDLLFGNFDVVVCDGFAGNIALKSIEGTAIGVLKMMKKSIKSGGIGGKIGALLLKPTFKKLKATLDVNEQAGGTVLGVDCIVVKAHGSSKATSIANCIEQVCTLKENDIINKIKDNLSEIGEDNNDDKQ